MTEPLYTRAEAAIIGRRDICLKEGHLIDRHYAENAAGNSVVDRYGCRRCDVIIRLDFPPLAAEGAATFTPDMQIWRLEAHEPADHNRAGFMDGGEMRTFFRGAPGGSWGESLKDGTVVSYSWSLVRVLASGRDIYVWNAENAPASA